MRNFNICSLQNISARKINLVLSFDDAYVDFYTHIWPLLKKYGLPATLAVPTNWIQTVADISLKQRLNIIYPQGLEAKTAKSQPLCTWGELAELAQSHLINIAAHSHNHCNLTHPGVDLAKEIVLPKNLLEDKLKTKIDTFVFPFGATNKQVNAYTLSYYKYALRIGGALNKSNGAGLLYRMDADRLWLNNNPLSATTILGLASKYVLNRVRGK